MSNIAKKIVDKVLPKATGKAVSVQGGCYAGCGSYRGLWVPSRGIKAGERAQCC